MEGDGQQEVALLVVFLPFPLLLPFLLFLPPFLLLLQLALLVEGVEEAEGVPLELVDLRMAVGVFVADMEVAHKVAGVGRVERKDLWDKADRPVRRAASFLAGHTMAAVRPWVADHKAVVRKAVVDKAVVGKAVVGKAVVDMAVVCKTAVHIARIVVVHMVVCHIAAELHTGYKAVDV